MNGLTKGLVGGAVASLLAYGAHTATGAGYIDSVETKAQGVLAASGVEGASLTLQRDPLSRTAIVTGVTDPAERERIKAELLANGGVRDVVFADEADESGADGDAAGDAEPVSVEELSTGIEDADAVTGATEEQVEDCQTSVNAFMEGKSINFESGSAYISPTSAAIIEGLGERLTACTGMSVGVGGHTDSTGSDETNMNISRERAKVVAAALSEQGVAAARITATGYGSSQPLVAGDGANAANRRIEFTLNAGSDTQEGGE